MAKKRKEEHFAMISITCYALDNIMLLEPVSLMNPQKLFMFKFKYVW